MSIQRCLHFTIIGLKVCGTKASETVVTLYPLSRSTAMVELVTTTWLFRVTNLPSFALCLICMLDFLLGREMLDIYRSVVHVPI